MTRISLTLADALTTRSRLRDELIAASLKVPIEGAVPADRLDDLLDVQHVMEDLYSMCRGKIYTS